MMHWTQTATEIVTVTASSSRASDPVSGSYSCCGRRPSSVNVTLTSRVSSLRGRSCPSSQSQNSSAMVTDVYVD